MFEVHGTQAIMDRLDVIAVAINTYVVSIHSLRVVLNLASAGLAFWLMQSMTSEAGVKGIVPTMRLCQRGALAFLSLGLFVRGAVPSTHGPHNEIIGLIITASLFVLLASSVVLVAVNQLHRPQSEIDKAVTGSHPHIVKRHATRQK